jgi:uncharacterized membrane-anchored protein YitT (DUF2179 family)
MNLESFSTKWFTIYYTILGLSLLGIGLYLMLQREDIADYLSASAKQKQPPKIFIRILKYFFLFTLPGLVLSFTAFS